VGCDARRRTLREANREFNPGSGGAFRVGADAFCQHSQTKIPGMPFFLRKAKDDLISHCRCLNTG